MENRPIKTISNYLKKVEELSKNQKEIWFRGHGQSEEWKLHPSLQRENIVKKEKELYTLYKQEAVLYIKDLHIDDHKAWLESAQHHGVPTRLLDFTTNSLNALYFACQNSENINDKNGKVFIFFVSEYLEKKLIKRSTNIDHMMFGNYKLDPNDRTKIDDEEIFFNMPVPYTPFYHDIRVALQSSRFLIWGKDEKKLEEQLTIDEINEFFPSIIISKKGEILNNLDKLGVNNKTVYPGLDSLGKYIKCLSEKNAKTVTL